MRGRIQCRGETRRSTRTNLDIILVTFLPFVVFDDLGLHDGLYVVLRFCHGVVLDTGLFLIRRWG